MRHAKRSPARWIWALMAMLTLAPTAPSQAAELDYTHWAEAAFGMIFADLFSPYADAIIYGESSRPGIDQYALKISGDRGGEDDGDKNVVVFECGMHAREWFAVESCVWLADYLLDNRTTAPVDELLEHVDVWIISHTNPAGRELDDPGLGDPTEYVFVCRGGSDEGQACADSDDCTDGTCYDTGWRTNANTASCPSGVDLARNFSSDWDRGSECGNRVCSDSRTACSSTSDCPAGESCSSIFMKFRGDAPFSEPESRNLRRFIHNRLVSTVAIVHANSQKLWHRSRAGSNAADYQLDQAVALNDAGSAGWTPDPSLAKSGVGGGVGQFSAWLTSPSDVAGESDEDTERNIATWFFEMPVAGNYPGSVYQEAIDDRSNAFHPSADDMRELWEDALRDAMLEVIRQARSPFCPVNASGARVTAECEADDFGLVGAKIADSAAEPGILEVDDSTREETAPAGEHEIVFAVQNFSAGDAVASTQATITVERNNTVDATYVEPVSLAGGNRGVFSVAHDFTAPRFGDTHYKVTIQLDADDYGANNRKVFRFRVGTPIVFYPLQVPGFGGPPRRLDSPLPPAHPPRLEFTAGFPRLERLPDPSHEGARIELRSFRPFLSGKPEGPLTVSFELPPGEELWRRARGGWVYRDAEGRHGELRALRLSPMTESTSERKRSGPAVELRLEVTGKAARELQHWRAWSGSVRFGAVGKKSAVTELVFVAAAEKVVLPPRKRQRPGKPEPEDEPDLGVRSKERAPEHRPRSQRR